MHTEIVPHSTNPSLAAPDLLRRRWFTAHVAAYLGFCFVQSIFLPIDALGLLLRAGLLVTVIIHFSWLSIGSTSLLRYQLQAVEEIVPRVPLLPDGQRSIQARRFDQNDFWYRWHDVG